MKRSLSQQNPTSVFKSGVEKLKELKPKLEGPPIGHYDVNTDFVYSKAESTFNILKNTSNFCQPLNCKRVKVDLYDPFKQVEDDRNKIPGPGAYNEQNSIADEIKYKNFKATRYRITKKESKNRKFLKLQERNKKINVTPGPGSYIEPLDRTKYGVAPVTNSMFKSDSLRDIYNLGQHRGPGPAFYKVKSLPSQKSYNYNPKRKWL